MKDWVSVLVQFGPIFLVVWWLGRNHDPKEIRTLRNAGVGCAASGICCWIGAKFFGLAVIGKKTVSRGDDAVQASLFLIAWGAAIFALYYLIVAVARAWRYVFPRRLKPPEEISTCRCPQCRSLLGSSEVKFCPVCEHHVVVRPKA